MPATSESWNFANCHCRDKLQLDFQSNLYLSCNNNFLLIQVVAVSSGRLFSIAKADWVLESCSLYRVERWPFLIG